MENSCTSSNAQLQIATCALSMYAHYLLNQDILNQVAGLVKTITHTFRIVFPTVLVEELVENVEHAHEGARKIKGASSPVIFVAPYEDRNRAIRC